MKHSVTAGSFCDMLFETLPVLVGVLDHGHGQEDLDMKACELRIQQCDLALDQAGLFEVADAAPSRTARHTRNLGEISLRPGRVFLQGIEQASICDR